MNEEQMKHVYHRFLDETGDLTFYGKGKVPIVGQQGVSKYFILGMLTLNTELAEVRRKVNDLQHTIASDPYFKSIASLNKRKDHAGYYLHAKDDVPEIRKMAFELISKTDCHFEAVVGTKDYDVYREKHNNKQAEFYADVLSHLLVDKMDKYERLVLNIANRGKCTANKNLEKAANLAVNKYPDANSCCKIVFNVLQPTDEPVINMADYFLWALQRKLERNEERYIDFIGDKFMPIRYLHAPVEER